MSAEDRRVRLLVFGDSWAMGERVDTWPELIAARSSGRTVNCAVGHSTSASLSGQWQEALFHLDEAGGLHEDALAIVHTGGNDLYFANPLSLLTLVASGAAIRLGCYRNYATMSPLLQHIAGNIAALVCSAYKRGVQRFIIAGVPLTTAMPMVRFSAAKLGVPGCLAMASSVLGLASAAILASIRGIYEQLERERSAPMPLALVVDETRLIEQALSHSDDDAQHHFWDDATHPSQAMHAVLADEVLALARAELHDSLDSSIAEANSSSKGGATETTHILHHRTPTQHEAMQS